MSAATASSAVAFAASVANARRAHRFISQDARASLVSALSSTIDAGFLRTRANDRHGSSAVDRATEISDVLRAVHLSTLENLYPGEAPVTTRSRSLAMRSTRPQCAFGTCKPLLLNSPPLNYNTKSDGSFYLSAEALAEIASRRTSCGTHQSNSAGAEFGLQAVRWINPFSTYVNLGDAQFPSAANSSVSLWSFTACGREMTVVNLSAPVKMALPITGSLREFDETEQIVEGDCESDGLVLVRCNATGHLINLTCPSKGSRWNVTCPRIAPVPACVFWDGADWSNNGVTVTNATNTTVHCTSSHLTNYLAIVGETVTGVKTNMAVYGEVTPAMLEKVVGVLCFLIGCYAFAVSVALRDLTRMRRANFLLGQEIWESTSFRESAIAIVDRDGEPEARLRANSVLAQVTAIEQYRARAFGSLRTSTVISPREAFGQWLEGLLQNHKIIAALGDSKPSYERAPTLLMELLSFLFGCALLHESDEEFIYSTAFQNGFLATCKEIVRSFPSALRETIVLCMAVLPAQWVVSNALANLHAARTYRESLQRKIIRDGVLYVTPDSSSLIDVHRAIHQSEAAVKGLVRFSKATTVNKFVAFLETYIGDLRRQSDRILEAPQDSNDIEGSSSQDSSLRMLGGGIGRAVRASSDFFGRVQQTVSGRQEVMTTQHRRKAREKRLILVGSLPSEVIHTFVYEDRLIAALPSWWQRQVYAVFLRQTRVPTLPEKHSNTTHPAFVSFILRFRGILLCVAYCLLATSFVFAFHLRQNSQHGRSQNANVSVVAIANTAIEVTIVTPFFMFVRLALLPTIAKLVLRRVLIAALMELEDTSRQSRSGTASSAFGARLVGANKARRKFLGLLKGRSSDGADIQPTDDDNIELSAVYPPSALTTAGSDDDSGINLSDSNAAPTTPNDVSGDDCIVALSAVDAAAAKSMFIEGSGEKHSGEELTVHSMTNPMHRDAEEI